MICIVAGYDLGGVDAMTREQSARQVSLVLFTLAST